MLTLKFVENKTHASRTVSVKEYTVTGIDNGGRVVEFEDEGVEVSNADNHDNFSVCYVMNQSGKTIDTIRPLRSKP